MSNSLLKNKVIIITGGCGLLGKESIRAVASKGGVGIIADINSELGIREKKEISKTAGLSVDFVRLDINSKTSVKESIYKISKKYGRIDALVNSAYPRNTNYGRDFFNVEYNDFCENLNIHLGGYFLSSQQYAKYFKEQGWGNIINIASIYGVIAPRFEVYKGTKLTVPVEYAVIKSALIHLTKYMAKYLRGTNIRVNSISPGGIYDKQPKTFVNAYNSYSLSKGMLDKKDLTGTLLFLLSEDSKYINGQNIIVDDGYTL